MIISSIFFKFLLIVELLGPVKDKFMFKTVKFLRIQEVIALIGLSRSTIYAKMNKNSPYYDKDFPKPKKLSKAKNGAIAWVLSEIEMWQLTRINS